MIKQLFTKKNKYKFEVAICCIVKDEFYLPEWVEYHMSIGVSCFFIYDNDSNIPVSETLKKYIEIGIVCVEGISGTRQQMIAYGKCLKDHGSKCNWIAFIDADEFIVPKTFSGNLPEFLMAYEGYGGLGINWLMFGSNGHIDKPPGLQVENYTLRALKSYTENNHIKSIVQPRYVKAIPSGPHNYHYKFGKYAVNENFKQIKGAFSPHSSNKIQLNHYWLRSESDFKEKILRGRADKTAAEYLRKMDHFYQLDKECTVADKSILMLKELIIQNRLQND